MCWGCCCFCFLNHFFLANSLTGHLKASFKKRCITTKFTVAQKPDTTNRWCPNMKKEKKRKKSGGGGGHCCYVLYNTNYYSWKLTTMAPISPQFEVTCLRWMIPQKSLGCCRIFEKRHTPPIPHPAPTSSWFTSTSTNRTYQKKSPIFCAPSNTRMPVGVRPSLYSLASRPWKHHIDGHW